MVLTPPVLCLNAIGVRNLLMSSLEKVNLSLKSGPKMSKVLECCPVLPSFPEYHDVLEDAKAPYVQSVHTVSIEGNTPSE